MDREVNENLAGGQPPPLRRRRRKRRMSRRRVLGYGAAAAAGVSGACAAAYYGYSYFSQTVKSIEGSATEVFKNDAPTDVTWELWQARGWAREGRHYHDFGGNVQCDLCPNRCVLEPEDRGRCRNRVNKDGTLYTLVYGNPCSCAADPIEKKPLFHFLPATGAFSIATSGCGFRCLNCQNWQISQSKPEETKRVDGEPWRLNPEHVRSGADRSMAYMSMFPEDVVAMAKHTNCKSIAYTYSEPTMFFEYMTDTCRAAHEQDIRNVWVTCGYINPEPLDELCDVMDAANVDLKSFDDTIYKELNSGKLQPILDCLTTLKKRGVWFEVTNLVVPTYTDNPDMIRRMCDWLVDNIGPDYPVHFSRFHPQHMLTHLPSTPIAVLVEARAIARNAGLRHVYIGNVRGVAGSETTLCPKCGKSVIERTVYQVGEIRMKDGKCKHCQTPIAGVWS